MDSCVPRLGNLRHETHGHKDESKVTRVSRVIKAELPKGRDPTRGMLLGLCGLGAFQDLSDGPAPVVGVVRDASMDQTSSSSSKFNKPIRGA